MKKILSIITVCCLACQILAFPAAAYSTRIANIPTVRLTINTGELVLGDQVSDDAFPYVSCPDNDYYYIDDAVWLDDVSYLKVGDAPRMRVYLTARPKEVTYNSYEKVYLFKGGYSSSNVHVTKGSVLAADIRDSGYCLEVSIRIDPVKGTYSAPINAYWQQNGVAMWEPDENTSGSYDLILYRGKNSVQKIENYRGTSFDFYPYMTKEGSYTFKVRSAPVASEGSTSVAGKHSEWTESEDLEITKDKVSDGRGAGVPGSANGAYNYNTANAAGGNPYYSGSSYYPNGNGGQFTPGWVQADGAWYFRYPNGELVRDSWMKLNEKWYAFDKNGVMRTGWFQNHYGYWFYLNPSSGAMRTGWLNENGRWYYLRDTAGDYEGTMVIGWQQYKNQWYFFNENGVMVTGWYRIGNSWYYFYPEGSTSGAYGFMATNTRIGDFNIGADGAWTGQ